MPSKSNNKKKVSRSQAGMEPVPPQRKPVRPARAVESRRPLEGGKAEAELTADLDMEWLREGSGRAEQEHIESLTDRVFASVLERCGWQRDEHGKIQHSGRS